MSDKIKGNVDIHADHAAFIAAYLRARKELTQIPGVLGVGFGRVNTGGEFKVALGLQVYVHEKRAVASLPPGELIPRSFEGYRVDVRVAQVMKPHRAGIETVVGYIMGIDTPVSPIVGGIQIEARRKSLPAKPPVMFAGTLGCIVKKRRGGKGEDNVYLLTNHHVATNEAFGVEPEFICTTGDYVYHPYAAKTTAPKPGLQLGEVQFERFKGEEPFGNHSPYLDCAIARIDVGSTCCGSVCGEQRVKYLPMIGGLGPDDQASAAFKDWITEVRDVCTDPGVFVTVDVPRDQYGQVTTDDTALAAALAAAPATAEKVRKVGRSTARTVGVVVSLNGFGYSEKLNGDLEVIKDFIEILLDPTFDAGLGLGPGISRGGNRSFADHGDSGSIVVDSKNQAIGLVFGGPPLIQRQGTNYGVTWASHIVPVIDKLGIYIPTKGGVNHGSDGATDGSGQALNSPNDLPQTDEASTLFASASVTSGAQNIPANEPRRPDLDGIGLRLRTTASGAELFDVIAAHQREIGCLVRGCRPVTVVWNRCKGPAFLAQTLNHLRGNADRMPAEINGVRRRELLDRMRAVLMRHGSYLLQRALEQHGDTLMLLADAETLDECLGILRRVDTAEVSA